MKHIKKKFLHEFDRANLPKIQRVVEVHEINSHKQKNDEIMLIESFSGAIYAAFHHKVNGQQIIIPEPDPILIYFNNAYKCYREILVDRKKLIDILSKPMDELNENIIQQLYDYFGLTINYTINLFTSIEAFLNRLIPKTYIYSDVKKNRTEVYNKDQILLHFSYDNKMKNVIPCIYNKIYTSHVQSQLIQNLKDYRDAIVHLKEKPEGPSYDYIFRKALDFKYEATLHAVRDFMNFYSHKYIEECECGNDF